MKEKSNQVASLAAMAVVIIFLIAAKFMTTPETVQQSFWALVPPIVAIALALITKEVYSSLFFGIVTGALLYSGYNFEGTINHVFADGVISVLSDRWNVGILCFLVILGTMVQLMNRAGGSAAFGSWAGKHIKTRVGAQLSTILLGCLIFIDDYFNCLTVGSVMRPVTDQHKISRAKLAYLIDATAAPICIIAPISSWAAAVSGFVEGENGMHLFLQTIPFNYYAIFTIIMMVVLVVMGIDYGSMAVHEKNAIEKNDLFTTADRAGDETMEQALNKKPAKVIDMLIPIISLVLCCVVGMIYTGGFFGGESFINAFANSDASMGLVLGSVVALVITLAFYLIRNVLSFNQCMDCLPEGFKQMVPAILILTFAWSLKAMTDSLGAKEYVAAVVKSSATGVLSLLPVIIFIIAVALAFATGTSWGTFGILIPIVVAVFQNTDHTMMIMSMSACMAGAVCGDHCSPISDTTIMSSAGAQCVHINHVSTQIPYALTAAAVTAVTYLISGVLAVKGITKNPIVPMVIGAVILVAVLFVIRQRTAEKQAD